MALRKGWVRRSGRTVVRMASSRNGNPRFMVTFDDGTAYPTGVDASCAYGIENREYDGDVQVLIERGNIVGIDVIGADLDAI